jgi:hypothetical protein
MFMTTITLGRRLVPLEQISLVEPFDPSANPRMQTDRPFKARVVLLNRDSILTEETAETFAEAQRFRALAEDGVFTNPGIHFSVEVFHPAPGFQPEKPYQSRLVWRDLDGNTQSKLLLTKPEQALAIAVRGRAEQPADDQEDPAALQPSQTRPPRRRSRRRERIERPAQG